MAILVRVVVDSHSWYSGRGLDVVVDSHSWHSGRGLDVLLRLKHVHTATADCPLLILQLQPLTVCGENSTYILHTHNYKLDGHEVKISRHFECCLFTVEVRGMGSHDIMYVCRFL